MARVKGAFAGFIIGCLMIPGSIALHAWNEYRTIHRTHGLNEAEHDVIAIEPDRIASDHDGKLVHVAGKSHTDDVLIDKEFGIRENAIHLRRTVKMYQWVETEHDDDGKTTYSYHKAWEEGRVNSQSFSRKQGHENPTPKFKSRSSSAGNVTIGAYRLNNALRDQMQNWKPIQFGESAVSTARPNDAEQFTMHENKFYWSENSPNPNSPEIGDLEIGFDHVAPDDVSLVAKLSGETFDTYRTSNGEPIERLYDGILSAQEIFIKLKTENTMIAWGIRLGGTALCVIGVFLLFGPIQKLFSWIPVVGNVTNNLFFLAALLIGFSISMVTISVSWIAVRPVLGIGLLAAAAVAFFFLSKLGGKPAERPDDVTVVTDDMVVG